MFSHSIRYIAVLGFQPKAINMADHATPVSIRYIAVLGFQLGYGKSVVMPPPCFHPLYRGTWFPTFTRSSFLLPSGKFPSAISRYLVSNVWAGHPRPWVACPVSIRYIAVLGFQPQEWLEYYGVPAEFPSAISRYLVSNYRLAVAWGLGLLTFPSAISRYLVSNIQCSPTEWTVTFRFHPLYRGTWFPTGKLSTDWFTMKGFHPLYRGTWFPTVYDIFLKDSNRNAFPSAISRYLVSSSNLNVVFSLLYPFPSAISRYLVSNSEIGASLLYRQDGSFHPLYRGTWFPTRNLVGRVFFRNGFPSAISRYLVSNLDKEVRDANRKELFPSAISRYLVSNLRQKPRSPQTKSARFHPLYRGTWFPTRNLVGRVFFRNGFPSAISRYLVSNLDKEVRDANRKELFPSAISRYLVSNTLRGNLFPPSYLEFPSAISRYLVSNDRFLWKEVFGTRSFHPLYRGTWFPTSSKRRKKRSLQKVSIRYIAVLGFQLAWSNIQLPARTSVSIRYIAVLGFQRHH